MQPMVQEFPHIIPVERRHDVVEQPRRPPEPLPLDLTDGGLSLAAYHGIADTYPVGVCRSRARGIRLSRSRGYPALA